MKQLTAFFLILCLLLSITACTSKEPVSTTAGAATAPVMTAAPTETEAPETFPDPVDKLDPEAVSGLYGDLTSQRAWMAVSFDWDTELYTFEVTWADSAFETNLWTMHCTDTGDTRLSYSDCEYKTVVYGENGESVETVQYQNGSGYFTYDGVHYLWDGAADENCRLCVFDRMPPVTDVPAQKGDPGAVIGMYMDMTSQRATMKLDYDFQKEIYNVEITWASSASEEDVWRMHWTDMGDGLYTYDDCIHLRIFYTENGEATTTILSEKDSGFFSYYFGDDLRVTENGILDRFLWDGATDENCRACVFEQVG